MRPRSLKVLLTGASGLLGSHLLRRLDGAYDLIALGRSPVPGDGLSSTSQVIVDMADLNRLANVLPLLDFDIAINCAAATDVDRCEIEHQAAYYLNTALVDLLAPYCQKKQATLIQLSTDYIFDGANGPYSEDDPAHPINYYGLTKLKAEEAIASSGCRFIIVRAALIYGQELSGPSKVLRSILSRLAEGKNVMAAVDQFSNPIWAGSLADAIIELLTTDFTGIINIAGPVYLSRYDFARLAAESYGRDRDLIVKCQLSDIEMTAPRPQRAGLRTDKMTQLFKTVPRGPGDGLKLVAGENG